MSSSGRAVGSVGLQTEEHSAPVASPRGENVRACLWSRVIPVRQVRIASFLTLPVVPVAVRYFNFRCATPRLRIPRLESGKRVGGCFGAHQAHGLR